MKKLRSLLYILALICLGCVAESCISDGVTTSSSDILTFSTDTVSFDTVFTELGTPTARLKVYNKAKKAVNISLIKFQNPSTVFTLNVDGVSGREFSDVEIMGNDSIFIFIECYLPEADRNTPVLTEDKLQFVTNGVTQNVVVEAYGQNVTRLRGLVLETDMTFTAERPYVIFDSLVVAPGTKLKIEPGANLLFHDKASMVVKGSVEAVGEPGKMINMRGDRIDDVLPDVGYDILAGQWTGIRFAADSYENRLEYVDMRSTSEGLVVDSCGNLGRMKLELVNSWIHNSQASAFKSSYAWVDAYGCVFSEAADAVVDLTGGSHKFVQCTLSNYYLFSAVSAPLLTLGHCLPDHATDNPEPLMSARFQNCILYGLPDDINLGDLSGSDVYLEYCSLKSQGENDDNFIECLWDTDPLFYTVRKDYYFNYRVKEDSPVIGAGDPAYVIENPQTMTDMDGLGRLEFGNPTLGAYSD